VKFKLDENLPPSLAEVFAAAGHEAHSVVQQALGGKPDQQVADVCNLELRALVTLDLDFSNILSYPPSASAGIVVLRLANQAHATLESAVRSMLALLPREPLVRRLWIVEDDSIRIRE
jgi:predicted nuclease of predicted toxin-antitoxin system